MLVVAEWFVPMFAEHHDPTQWYPHHIAERYGLFTIILLGESLLASATALIEALSEGHHTPELLVMFLCAFTVVACLWWIYFWPRHHQVLSSF